MYYTPLLPLLILLPKQDNLNLVSGTSCNMAPVSFVDSQALTFLKHILTLSPNKMF